MVAAHRDTVALACTVVVTEGVGVTLFEVLVF